MFRKGSERPASVIEVSERVDSILGGGIAWQGSLSGAGGVRIDGTFEGEIALRGLVVIGETGRVSCREIRATTVVVAGSLKGDILAQRVEITRSGRVWGDVTTTSFSTEEGAFLRGQIRMEEKLDLGLGPDPADSGSGGDTPDPGS
ncbi:MAG: polymer-forming cytoskeletal protein [Anaerolineales bacterium]|nr:polymer-forming cytoskeletal protein [Anaerolineales bacterium]